MFSAIGWLIKVAFFSVLVLILGNWVEFGGKTVNDQVKTQISHAESSEVAHKLKSWAGELTQDARDGIRKKTDAHISATERQKLRQLIRDLNGSKENPNQD